MELSIIIIFFETFLYKHPSSDKIKVVLDFHSTSTTLFSATLEACAAPHKSAFNACKAPTKVPTMPAKVQAMPAITPIKREYPEKPEELRIIVFSQKYFIKVPAKCLQRLQSTYKVATMPAKAPAMPAKVFWSSWSVKVARFVR